MLPGTRAFSDEDITSVVVDSLAVFGNITDENHVPEDLRGTVFATIVGMVTQRNVPAQLGGLDLSQIKRGAGH